MNNKLVIPPPLRPGSTIGIVAPSGRLHDNEGFIKGIGILRELGFRTKFPREFWPGDDYLADCDNNRLREFLAIWNDSEVEAVMAARGGYGCLRIADRLLTKGQLSSPKRFIGFSDITLLHDALGRHHHMVSLHGPVITSLPRLSPKWLRQFRNMLVDPLEAWDFTTNLQVLQGSGKVKGVMAGGNLSTIVSCLGTPVEMDWKGKIIFLEDTGEHRYRIDRMLTQLKLNGKLDSAAAIVLGDFSDGLGLDRIEAMRHHEAIWKRLLELVSGSIPVWADFPIGHGRENMTLPLGLQVILDCSKGRLTAC